MLQLLTQKGGIGNESLYLSYYDAHDQITGWSVLAARWCIKKYLRSYQKQWNGTRNCSPNEYLGSWHTI